MGDLLDLAREAVALPGWRWMPGMRGRDVACRGFLLVALHHSGGAIVVPDGAITTLPVTAEFMARCLPDLADPATLGCLLALVREAWPTATLCHVREDHAPPGRWVWCWRTIDDGGDYGCYRLGPPPFISRLYSDEAHALVAALRAGGARG